MNQTGSFTSLDDWLGWLETLSPREIDLGLERVDAVLKRLDLPRAERVINVAGTNGKGSSVAMLEALLANAGYQTACYTSPHVLRSTFSRSTLMNSALTRAGRKYPKVMPGPRFCSRYLSKNS